MPKHLIITKPNSRSKIELVAALIALVAQRRKLTRWVVTKQDVFDLLEKHKQLQSRVRTAGFHSNLEVAMNEHNIATFEINANTWGFIRHETTRNWHRATWDSLTESELTNPDVFDVQTDNWLNDSPSLEQTKKLAEEARERAIKRQYDFLDLHTRFVRLTTDYPVVREFSSSYGPVQALNTKNVELLALHVKSMESMILAQRLYKEDMSCQQYMGEIVKLAQHFDTSDLINDSEGNRCEVTERHITERKWDTFLPLELYKILEDLKGGLRIRYECDLVMKRTAF